MSHFMHNLNFNQVIYFNYRIQILKYTEFRKLKKSFPPTQGRMFKLQNLQSCNDNSIF